MESTVLLSGAGQRDVPSPSPGVNLIDNFLLRGYSGDDERHSCVIGWLNDDIVSLCAKVLTTRKDYAEDMLE